MPDPCAWASGDRSLVGWWSQRRRRRAWCWQRTCRDDLSDLATVVWKASQIPTSTDVPRPVVTRGLPPPPPTVFEEDCIRHLMLALLRCCCHRTGIATPIMRPPFTVFALACFFPFTSMAWAWASRATAFQSRIEKQQSSAALRDRGDCVSIIVVYTCVLYTWAINFNLRLYMPGHCVHLSFRCQWWHVCFS